MLRLSIKDIRIYWFTLFINFAFWTIMAPAAIQSPDIYLLLPIGFGLIIIMIPLGNDVRDGRDILYASLPIKRSKIIAAKYLSSFFLVAMAFIWLILLGLVLERYLPDIVGDFSGSFSFESIVILAFLITLVICIYLPFVLRFGFSAVISGGIAITALVMAGFWLGSSYLITRNTQILDIETGGNNNLLNNIAANNLFRNLGGIIKYYGSGIITTIIILVIIITILISITISIKIFSRKEF